MYAGKVNVKKSDLSEIIKTAECLRVKGLAIPDEPPAEKLNQNSVDVSKKLNRKSDKCDSPSPPRKRRRNSGMNEGNNSISKDSGNGDRKTPVPNPDRTPSLTKSSEGNEDGLSLMNVQEIKVEEFEPLVDPLRVDESDTDSIQVTGVESDPLNDSGINPNENLNLFDQREDQIEPGPSGFQEVSGYIV